MRFAKINYSSVIIFFITLVLFIIPFFWLKPGETDLGGDSSRLYYYQPLEYLRQEALYAVSKSAFGAEILNYFNLPHFLFLAVLKLIFQSPTLLIDIIYGFNLSLAFLFIFLIARELIGDLNIARKDSGIVLLAGISAGLYYIFPPLTNTGWNQVLLTFNQVFLNPMIFYLLLKFFLSRSFRYMIVVLLLTFIFAPNFSFTGAPPFFAFYPLSLIFLVLYVKIIKKQSVPVKGLLIGAILFAMLHLFHVLPIVVNIFTPGSVNAMELFSYEAIVGRGLGYFTGIAGSVRVSFDLLGIPQLTSSSFYAPIYFIFPFLMLLGFFWNKKSRIFILSGIFYLISLFWVTAKITNIGFEFYKVLFFIPGFSMFRNFIGQWRYLYLFFYSLLLGQALAIIFIKVPIKRIYVIFCLLLLILLVPAWPFIKGDYIRKGINWQSNDVKTLFQIDPMYEEVLGDIRKLPADGKILTLPLTDPGYQLVAGANGGVYKGPSTISYLTPKQDVTGFDELGPFKEFFITSVRNQDYKSFIQLLQMLNIKYVFYNADPLVYDPFLYHPYEFMRTIFPTSQAGYKKFLSKLPLTLIFSKANKYFLYKLSDDIGINELYVAHDSSYFNQLIKDWSVPLMLQDSRSASPAIFDYKYNPPKTTHSYVVAEPDSIFLKVLKNRWPPLDLIHAFATTPPNSPMYPLIVFKEELALRLKGKTDETYLLRHFLLAAKRIFELEKWGKQMDIRLGEVKNYNDLTRLSDHSIWNSVWQNHNQIEVMLAYYARYMNENIQKIDTSKEDYTWKQTKKFLVNEYILQHRSRLIRLIPQLVKTQKEKEYLDNLVDMVFGNLTDRLSYAPLDISTVYYKISLPQEHEAHYQVEVEHSALTNFDNNVSVRIGRETLYKSENQALSSWDNFGEVTLGNKEAVGHLDLSFDKQKNLLQDAERFSVENATISSNSAVLSTDASLVSGKGGLIWKLVNWHPESYYVLSFDYKTLGAPFFVRIVNANSNADSSRDSVSTQILEDELYAQAWQRYQVVVQASKFTDTGFLQFTGGSIYVPIAKLELKNLSLYEVPHPNILLRKVSEVTKQNVFPTLTYSKVNPTKYLVHIDNPTSLPFIIVLNQQYHAQWKVYMSPKSGASIASRMLSGWPFKSLSDKNHYEANGYANAWYIDPKEVGGATTYDVTIEMTAQHIFYAGLVVLAVGLGALVYLWLRPVRL